MSGYPRPYSIVETQSFVYETDYLPYLLAMLQTVMRVTFHPPANPKFKPHLVVTDKPRGMPNDGAIYNQHTEERGEPRYVYVCSVHDYETDAHPPERDGNDLLWSGLPFDAVVSHVEQRLKVLTLGDLVKHCGDGFSDGFDEFDGSIELGYRIEHRPSGGWSNFDISLCHVYYGK